MKLINSIQENCRLCYACIRVCPAKALKIENGFSQVIEDRCIGCGNCVTVCSPKALVYYDSTPDVRKLLESGKKVVAICAPSIAGEFPDITSRRNFVGMIKALGFSHVCEVAFGADLVGRKYRELLASFKGKYYITTNCPAVVNYVEKYHPQTISNLAPIMPPMAATSKVVHDKYGPDIYVVYIGPCTAAKRDALRYEGDARIDAVLTFVELRRMFKESNITEITVEYSEFDSPKGGKGTLFPISHGLFQSVGINEDLLTGRLIVTEGRSNFIEAIKEFEDLQELKKHLDIFYCDGGCTMGPGTSPGGKKFHRRTLVIEYTKKRLLEDQTEWKKNLEQYLTLDLTRQFTTKDQRMVPPDEHRIQQVLKSLGKETENDYLNCGACGYETCKEFAGAITHGLARPEMCIIYSIKDKQDNIKNLKIANEKLEKTRQALEESERLAQMEKEAFQEASVTTQVMLQKIPSGVVIVDKDLKITHSNQCFINLLGEDAEAINEVIPGLKGADLKTLLPPNVIQFFQYAINSEDGVENRDITIGDQLLNLSVFPLKKGEIAGAIIRDMYLPDVRREEVIHRITEVIDKNLNMVQNIGFLLGEGASQTERMLNSIMNSYKSDKK